MLIPALILGQDFIPTWYILLYSGALSYIAFFIPLQLLSLLNFVAVYFIFETVGRMIVPETMVPILGIFIISRLINNKKTKKFEMYPLFLWIGAFAIFSSSFYYLIYSLLTLLIVFLYQNTDKALSIKTIFKSINSHKKQLVMSALITILLFVFFPRFYNFLPTTNINTQGKIGYSKKVDNSQTSNLLLSSQTAFYAELSVNVSPELLYWRGRVHTKTDGYNWSKVTMDPKKQTVKVGSSKIIQTIKYEQDFDGDIILLNTPLKMIDSNLRIYRIPITNEFRSYEKKKKSIVTAESALRILNKTQLKDSNRKQYLQLPGFIPREVKNFVSDIKGTNPNEVINSFKRKLLKDNFVYTLSPGVMPTIGDFLRKKLGYCTHYSSLLGLTLRLKGIPTRLVSGFQGGQYNNIGNFYEIKSNDAHVWVEYFSEGIWKQADPTSFISPDRIRLGGENFLNPGAILNQEQETTGFFRAFNTVRLYFDNLNYKISLFLDNYDRTKQSEISKALKLGLKSFFLIGFFIITFSIGIYYFLLKKKDKVILHPADVLLNKLDKKLKKSFLNLASQKTILDMKHRCRDHAQSEVLYEFLDCYQETRYSNHDQLNQMGEILKSIKS
ncbi:MAG: transglutaminase-like putative cysteine protease [Bacteriovoracaceae bacterium]|jgi:transglutaminase-like putative cysteine protease